MFFVCLLSRIKKIFNAIGFEIQHVWRIFNTLLINTQLMMNIKTQFKRIQVLALVLIFLNINTAFAQILDMPQDGDICVSTEPIFVFNSTSNTTTVEILDCNISSIGLPDYTLENTFSVETNPNGQEDDLSGITYNPITNTLFTIANGGKPGSIFEAIYEVDLAGNTVNIFNLVDAEDNVSASTYFEDTEGIVHLYDRTFAVVEEYDGNIAIIDLPTSSANIYRSDADIIELPGIWNNNNGLEGISYDPIANQFHVVKEKSSRKYYVVDMPTTFPETAPNYTEYSLQIMNITDAAGTHNLGLTPRFANTDVANHRLIVDEAGSKVVEIDANFQIVDELPLYDQSYEGITMDNNGTIYMAQEPNLIRVFTNPNLPGVVHSVEVSQSGYFMPPSILEESTEYCWRIIGDDGSISDTYSFTTMGTMTICAGISSGGNDIEELQNGNMYVSSSDLELIYDSNTDRLKQKIGLRYEDLGIPQGSIIVSAYLQFTTDEISTGTVNLTIHGEDADDASPFTLTNGNLSARPTTQAAVGWSPPNWSIVGEQNSKQQTPDLTAIVQEIVNRNGFDQSSAVAFIISGTNTSKRIAESFEGNPNLAPQLCITFTQSCIIPDSTCVDAIINLSLEGAYEPTGDTMRTGLRQHVVLPLENIGTNPLGAQPYFEAPWYYPGTEGASWGMSEYEPTVVDWVFVEIRIQIPKYSKQQHSCIEMAMSILSNNAPCPTT